MDYTGLESEIAKLVVEAGLKIKEIFLGANIGTTRKDDGSLVTTADKAADAIIRRGLTKAFPEIAVVSEENPQSHKIRADRFFLVDPLDGTRGFVSGSKEFTVNIALIEGREPRVGAVYAPLPGSLVYNNSNDELFEAETNTTEFVPKRVIRNAASESNGGGLRIVASRSKSEGEKLEGFLSGYRVSRVSLASSSIKFCQIVLGEAELYPRFGPTSEWDTAAGHAILVAAGGQALRMDNFKPLQYGKPDYKNPGFIACGPGIEPYTGN